MRKLILADVPRFAAMVEAAGVREIVADGLKRGAAEAVKKQEQLLRLKRALDEATEPAARDDIMRQMMTAQKDDTGLYRVGIDVGMQVLAVTAQKGVLDSVYDFLAPITEMEREALAEMPLEDFAKLLRQLLAENDFGSFFGVPGLPQAKSAK